MVWEHKDGDAIVAIRKYRSGPKGRSTQKKTKHYFSVFQNTKAKTQQSIVEPYSNKVNTANKKDVRKATVKWMREHPREDITMDELVDQAQRTDI